MNCYDTRGCNLCFQKVILHFDSLVCGMQAFELFFGMPQKYREHYLCNQVSKFRTNYRAIASAFYELKFSHSLAEIVDVRRCSQRRDGSIRVSAFLKLYEFSILHEFST